MANGSPYCPEPDPPWWRVTRGNAWHKFNALLAIAIGVYVIGFQFGATYDWLSERTLIFFAAVLVFAIAGGIALVGWVQEHRGAIAGTWATLGAVYMVFALGHAAGDSTTQRHSNCWRVSGSSSDEIVACAPDSEPASGSTFSEATGSGRARYCDFLRDGDGKVSIWHCEEDEF
jgi:hypothetical protein